MPKRVVTIVCDSGARYLSKQVGAGRVRGGGGGGAWGFGGPRFKVTVWSRPALRLALGGLCYCLTEPNPTQLAKPNRTAKPKQTQFNDYWMRDQGLHPRPVTGDVRDLIARRHLEGEDVWVTPELPVDQAIRRMRAHGISQMAVLSEAAAPAPADGGGGAVDASEAARAPARAAEAARVVGIIDESDLLLALLRDGAGATALPVSRYMEPRVETVPPTAAPAELLPMLRAGRVAVVAGPGGTPFYGLVTNIDLINYLRARVD